MKTVKFAFIGCGKIAQFHADAIRYLGHSIDVVVAKENSPNIDGFAERYGVAKKIHGIGSFLAHYDKFSDTVDCILVCTPWDVTENVLRQLLPLGVPIMAEKPVVLSIAALEDLKKKYEITNLFVAYNRRFYDFVPFLKELVESESPVCADILSAEPYEMIVKKEGEKIRDHMLYFYTSHIIDLMYYLFGEISIHNVTNISEHRNNSWVCELYSPGHKCPIQMKILMDCPQNSHFKIFFEKKVVEMCPFEKMVVYNDLERKENQGKATYVPVAETEWHTEDTFKPGFLNQMKHFIENFVYRKNRSLEYIELLKKVTCLCDTLRKSRRFQ